MSRLDSVYAWLSQVRCAFNNRPCFLLFVFLLFLLLCAPVVFDRFWFWRFELGCCLPCKRKQENTHKDKRATSHQFVAVVEVVFLRIFFSCTRSVHPLDKLPLCQARANANELTLVGRAPSPPSQIRGVLYRGPTRHRHP